MATQFKKHGFWKGILFAILLATSLSLSIPNLVRASDFLPLPSSQNLDVPAPQGDTTIQKLENGLGPIARNLRIILGGVSVLFIVISGFIMVMSGDNEEKVKAERQSIAYGLIGLMIISIAGPIAEIFDYRNGDFAQDPDALLQKVQLFDTQTQLIVNYIKYLLGALATLMFIRSGALMVISADNEDIIGREKKNLALGAGGLFLVLVSDLVIKKVFYVASFDTQTQQTVVALNQNEFIRQLVAFSNLAMSFVGPVMVLGIVVGGVMYVTSGGDEERMGFAKKVIENSIIGIIIIYGAFALVSTVIAGRL